MHTSQKSLQKSSVREGNTAAAAALWILQVPKTCSLSANICFSSADLNIHCLEQMEK